MNRFNVLAVFVCILLGMAAEKCVNAQQVPQCSIVMADDPNDPNSIPE